MPGPFHTGAVATFDQNFSGRKTVDDNGSGNAAVVGGLLYNSVAASTAVTNTTSETAFDKNYAIPANSLRAGDVLRCRFQGIALSTNSTDTLAIKLYIGTDLTAGAIVGTALISAAAVDAANSDIFTGEFDLVIRTIGASGTCVGIGTYKTTAAEGTATIKDDYLASTAIDTTAAQTIFVTATWSVAHAANHCRLDVMTVRLN